MLCVVVDRRSTARVLRPALAATLTASSACLADQGTLGAPCDVGGDCDEGLLCDRHDSGGGSCQRVHDDADEPQALDCSVDTRDDVYMLGLSHRGAWAEVAFVDAQPAPPERGDNTWVVRIMDDDVARDDLEIAVEPYMPDHTHGSTVRCEVEPGAEPGTYVLSPLNLFMPGLWEITLVIRADDLGEDEVQFRFCVDP